MKTTPYFEQSIKRHHVPREYVEEALANAVERVIQKEDQRIRVYGFVEERKLYMRVVLLEDGETVHNAFFDENYTRKRRR